MQMKGECFLLLAGEHAPAVQLSPTSHPAFSGFCPQMSGQQKWDQNRKSAQKLLNCSLTA
jgi:hypothetical protein